MSPIQVKLPCMIGTIVFIRVFFGGGRGFLFLKNYHVKLKKSHYICFRYILWDMLPGKVVSWVLFLAGSGSW
jgi:hypothetical protein